MHLYKGSFQYIEHLPLWLGGLVRFFRRPDLRDARVAAWIWIFVFALLAFSGRGVVYYLVPAYPPLLACGAGSFPGTPRQHAEVARSKA